MFKLLTAALCALLTVSGVGADGQRDFAAPRDVHFHSVNLRNVARWSSGTADARDTTYTVQYAIYGDAVDVEGTEQVVWRPVHQCDDVTQMECDVTEQTNDTEEEYYVRVRANGPNGRSEWTETDRRLRLADTILGPPQVNVTMTENTLHVKLSGPFRWRNPGKKRQSMFNILPHMVYNISVYSSRSKRTESFLQPKKLLHHGPMEYASEYCVRAEALSLSLHLTSTASEWTCVSTPDDPIKSHLLLTMLGGVIPTSICLFVLAAVCGFAYYYICGHKPQLPKSVKDIQSDVDVERNAQTFQPEKHLPINVIIINSTTLSFGDSKRSFLGSFNSGENVPERSPLSVLGDTYASQNFQHTAGPASAAPQSHRGSLTEDYGLVSREDGNQVPSCPYNPHATSYCVGGVNSYTAQTGTTEPAQETYENEEEEGNEEEEDTQIFCNWDRETGQLQLDFPLLSRFGSVISETTETQMTGETVLLPRHPVLTSVVIKHASEESAEDDLLLKMENEWALQVQSTAE